MFRIFLASDVHASDIVFRKFSNSGQYYKADALILAGDVTGKALVFIKRNADGTFAADYLGTTETARNEEELETLLRKLANRGYYCRIVEDGDDRLADSQESLNAAMLEEMIGRVENWMGILDRTLSGTGKTAYLLTGNDDPREISEKIKELENERIQLIDESVFQLGSAMEGIGLPYANITPWHLPGDISEEELATKIETLAKGLTAVENSVFVIHVPPKDTVIDVAPMLRELRLQADMTGIQMEHVGSTAVRDAILRYQPLATLHGHIHESRGTCVIGRTRCFNAGSEYEQGILRGVLINVEGRPPKIKGYMFVSG